MRGMTQFQGSMTSTKKKRPTWATMIGVGFFLIAFALLLGTIGALTSAVVLLMVSAGLGGLGAILCSFGAYIYFMEKTA